jgi:AmmeMemoRadiSam system protein B/AmmeMemoRadiSam system protein A
MRLSVYYYTPVLAIGIYSVRGTRVRVKVFTTACAVLVLAVVCAVSIPQDVKADRTKDASGGAKTAAETGSIREPAVAGSFYPSDLDELETMVDGYLAEAALGTPTTAPENDILMILVPHAGYVFSGKTAAYAFSMLHGKVYDTVILLGCPHQVPVRGAAVYCGKGFRIPPGIVPVDTALANAVIEASDLIVDDPRPHLPEHSLEVELPFLSRVLGSYSIVPILVSGDANTLELISQAIVDALRRTHGSTEGVLFLISTDLSHYPKQEDAQKSDSEILDAFCTLDTQNLVSVNNEIMGRGIEELRCTMCGLEAAYVGIRIANIIGATKAILLHKSTSADAGVPGASSERVVGYGAVVITGHTKKLSSAFKPLTKEEQEYLLGIARLTLKEYLKHVTIPETTIPVEYRERLSETRGVFVSLYKDGQLRGCIGSHSSSLPLSRAVQLMTLKSGLDDPRFPPLTLEELDTIKIEISVYLSSVDPISTIEDFMVGKHGIIINKDGRSATFLPHVATKQGWDKKTTLQQLCKKAGLEANAWKAKDAQFRVYETQIFCEE